MNRKEKRRKEKNKRKELKSKLDFRNKKEKEDIINYFSFSYFQLGVAVTLLAVKDEKRLSAEKAKAVVARLNSLIEEFNDGNKGRLNVMLNLVKDELDIDLRKL